MFAIRYGGVTRLSTMYETEAEAQVAAKRLYSPDMKGAVNGPFIVRVRPELEVATSAIFQWCTTRSASDAERVVHSLPKEAAAGWQLLVETKGSGVGAYLVCARWPTPLGIREERIILYNRRLERSPLSGGSVGKSTGRLSHLRQPCGTAGARIAPVPRARMGRLVGVPVRMELPPYSVARGSHSPFKEGVVDASLLLAERMSG